MEQIRLNKYLAEIGVGSRRFVDSLIQDSKVKVNGVVVGLGTKINPEKDTILVDGKRVGEREDKVYYILNKPKGYITTSSDPHGRKKVTDLVPKIPRVYPVGRLDHDTSGLLLLTNDGDLAYRLTHPKFEKEKEYEVKVKNQKSKIKNIESLSDIFTKGIRLSEGVARADKVEILEQKDDMVRFSIVVHQGWNRQIRRMCEMVGLEVISLRRIRIGDIGLNDLREGEYKEVKREIKN